MKNKFLLLLLSCLIGVNLLFNSCKKENSSTISTLLTSTPWQLASVQVYHYLGGNQTGVDTLNTTCSLQQVFAFSSNNTCSFTNYNCEQQSVSGHWQLTKDQLTLQADLAMKDTTIGRRDTVDHPFAYAKIANLGLYSMVLETGDINSYYTASTVRRIVRYGFIHVGQ